MSDTPSYGIDVLSNPKQPYFDNSNTSKQEFCYIPKDNIFLGHPVVLELDVVGAVVVLELDALGVVVVLELDVDL